MRSFYQEERGRERERQRRRKVFSVEAPERVVKVTNITWHTTLTNKSNRQKIRKKP